MFQGELIRASTSQLVAVIEVGGNKQTNEKEENEERNALYIKFNQNGVTESGVTRYMNTARTNSVSTNVMQNDELSKPTLTSPDRVLTLHQS